MRAQKNKTAVFNAEKKEKNALILKGKRIIRYIKKNKIKENLRKKISKKRIKKFHTLSGNRNLFFSTQALSPLETQFKQNLTELLSIYDKTNKIEQIHANHIDEADKNSVDKKFKNACSYRYFYNKLSGKIQTYQLIDTDQGTNFRFSPNIGARILNLLTYGLNFIPAPLINGGSGGLARCAINISSDQRKIKKTKNKLDHCITETNFIKLLSILLTKIHEPDFSQQENLDLFLGKQFKNFWSVFKKQVKENPNREDLGKFWSECLLTYFQELKCPLLKENCFEKIDSMLHTRTKETPTNSLPIDNRQSADDTPSYLTFMLFYNNLDKSLKQQFLMACVMQPLLSQLCSQAFTQQCFAHSLNIASKPASSSYTGFFGSTKEIPHNPIASSRGMTPCC